ncbi:alanine/glycine:cation symporter family protein [Promicromonospora sp. Marseille-Q5078]
MESFNEGLATFNDGLWLYLVVPVLAALCIYFTVRSRAVQIRLIPDMLRAMVAKAPAAPGEKPVSSFQAFAISAAARIGTGNIVGVATAVALGGAGAVFWMWVMALVVGAASFVESTLAQLYKVRDGKDFRGGPAYYMERGLGKRWMGLLFSVVIIVTFSFVFNSVQANTIAGAIGTSAEQVLGHTPGWLAPVVGVLLTAIVAAVVFGGLHRIANTAQLLVPLMVVLYLGLGVLVVALNVERVPEVVASIVGQALGFQEFAAAGIGTAISQGVRRGMFSNEGGLGSAPNAAATANVSHPVKQGLVQTLGVYIDTLLVCSVTAFIVLVSDPTYGENSGPTMTQEALQSSLGTWSLHLLTVILLLLAFTSVLGNYYYGESNVAFLTRRPAALTGFRVVFLVICFLGSIGSVQLIWTLADTTMAVMALVNLAAIAPLSPIVFRLLRDFTAQRKQGLDPQFSRDKVPDLTGIECWEPRVPERVSVG